MTAAKPMTTLRRRAMPGMPVAPPPPAADPTPSHEHDQPEKSAGAGSSARRARRRPTASGSGEPRRASARRHFVEDYSDTHLANFRLPVDLHARYGRLVAEAQQHHPRVRKMSLTEVLIALLIEGPQTPDEVAELIRRKRAHEHSEDASR